LRGDGSAVGAQGCDGDIGHGLLLFQPDAGIDEGKQNVTDE